MNDLLFASGFFAVFAGLIAGFSSRQERGFCEPFLMVSGGVFLAAIMIAGAFHLGGEVLAGVAILIGVGLLLRSFGPGR